MILNIESLKIYKKGAMKMERELEKIINLDENKLLVLAGRPSMGKTSLAFNIAVNIAQREKVSVAIFSLEMSKEYIHNNIIDSSLLDTHIFIDDTPGISVENIRRKCLKLKREKNIGLVIIDYLQLVSVENKTSREQELSTISHSLKKLAEELNIPIVATGQLSKEPDTRFKAGQDPRTKLEDFKYSAEIIKDADTIMLLYRDDYYYPDSPKKNIVEVNIAKNKNGSLGTIELVWLKEHCKFENFERYVK